MRTKRGLALILGGLLLIAAALGLTAYNLLDNQRAKGESAEAYSILSAGVPKPIAAPQQGALQPQPIPDYELNPEIPMPEIVIDGWNYIALLEIPALGLKLPVMGDCDYERLRSAPCRDAGSIYTDDLVICAHNYACHFGSIYTLGWGDELTLTDMHGNVFRYRVIEQELLEPEERERMLDAYGWDLTLYTCTVGGQSRVTVRCERME